MNTSSPRNSPMPMRNTVVAGSTARKCWGPEGCPAVANGRRCGETRNLEIIQEFKRLYEMKMQQIDDAAGGDCVQAKINLQQEWIRDLTEQNEMLVRVVEELEVEAAERVTMLEEKLQQSARCACEVMGSYKDFSTNFLADFQRMGYVQNDLNNLIEVLRRVKQRGIWSSGGLNFYTVNIEELMSNVEGALIHNRNMSFKGSAPEGKSCKWDGDAPTNCKSEKAAKEKEKKIKELEEKIRKLHENAEANEETKKICQQYQDLKKSMLDMRDALTAEVAEKHDTILCLRREVHMLEDQCRKADQQTHFKDDIIKELRKEIKQLKLQVQELEDYEKKHRDSLDKVNNLRQELERYKQEHNGSLTRVKTLSDENRTQAEAITNLKEKLRKSAERPPTATAGVNARVTCRDASVDAYFTPMKHVGISSTPETKTVSTLSDIENQIIPIYMAEQQNMPKRMRSVSCETTDRVQCAKRPEPRPIDRNQPRRQTPQILEATATTADSYQSALEQEHDRMTVVKPPALKRDEVADVIEVLKPETLISSTCNSKFNRDNFKYIPNKLTTTADQSKMQEFVSVEMADRKPVTGKSSPKRAEVLYDAKQHMYQTSNESITSSVPLETSTPKSVRIATRTSPEEQTEARHYRRYPQPRFTETESDENASGAFYSMRDESTMAEEVPCTKKEVVELYAPWKQQKVCTDGGKRSRSTSPKVSLDATRPAEDLQTVVNDLNESVSRIIEKTPKERATREKIAQLEAQLRAALLQKEREVDMERQRRNQEVENLKLTIREMEKALQNKEENGTNLQNAVDLYLNSINVLEQSEEHYKNEVAQQRITISNLQEALVATKQQLDELKEKCQRDLEDKCILLDILDVGVSDLEKQCYHYYNQYLNSSATTEFLRDEILNLEVQKFDLTQDVLLLEARLLKYQEISKQYEGKYLGSECSEYCIKQNESVVTLAQDTICYTEDLQCQIAVLQTALKREQKINVVQATRIEELQGIIGAKNLELSRATDAYQDVKSKFDAALARSKGLEDAIRELQEQLNEMEMDNLYKEEKSDICHGELDMCLNNLQSVKFKLRAQYKAMCQKMQEFTQLQADCKIHANNADMLKRDLENTRIRYRDEIIELKHNIRDLKEKLVNSEDKIEALNKEVKHSQALLVEASHHETKIKQDFHTREKQLTEKIHSAQEEEMRLLDVVTQLEQEILHMKNELDSRDVQLESAKATILQMNADALTKQQLTQEEINKLKNEINGLIQQQGVHKAESERLQQQLECMKCCLRQNEADNKIMRQQLDQCLCDMKIVEQEKTFLEQRNTTLVGMMEKMQAALQSKTDSLASMEVELLETKTSRDEICIESRNVVFNVRAWLDEQKKINEELKQKLQKKNMLLSKYEQERRRHCEFLLPPRSDCPRQRGGGMEANYFENDVPQPVSRSPWSLDSRGSGSESPSSSASSTAADWYEYEEVGYDAIVAEPTAELWIHRVESMTEELQRSNRYWKKKINDCEFMVTKDK